MLTEYELQGDKDAPNIGEQWQWHAVALTSPRGKTSLLCWTCYWHFLLASSCSRHESACLAYLLCSLCSEIPCRKTNALQVCTRQVIFEQINILPKRAHRVWTVFNCAHQNNLVGVRNHSNGIKQSCSLWLNKIDLDFVIIEVIYP